MARLNKAVPIWNEEKQIWKLQKQINGKRKYFKSSNKKGGYQECIRLYNSWLGQGAKPKDPRVKDVADDYLKSIIDEFGLSSPSYRDAESAMRLRILPALKNKKIYDLSEQDFQNILNKAKNLVTGKSLSKKTVQNIHSEINLFCKYLYKSDLIDWVPQYLEVPKKLEYQGKNYWQADEAIKFLRYETNNPCLLACKLILIYGTRPGEIYGLQGNSVKNNVLLIKQAYNEKKEITQGKNKNAIRKEMLTDYAKKNIEKAISYKKENDIESPFIFSLYENKLINGKRIRYHLKKYCIENNVSKITPYGMRHTLGTIAKHNLSERQIKQIYGHSKAMNTDIYIHELDDEHLITGKALNNYWNELLDS